MVLNMGQLRDDFVKETFVCQAYRVTIDVPQLKLLVKPTGPRIGNVLGIANSR